MAAAFSHSTKLFRLWPVQQSHNCTIYCFCPVERAAATNKAIICACQGCKDLTESAKVLRCLPMTHVTYGAVHCEQMVSDPLDLATLDADGIGRE